MWQHKHLAFSFACQYGFSELLSIEVDSQLAVTILVTYGLLEFDNSLQVHCHDRFMVCSDN